MHTKPDRNVESLALAGAGAIQQLIAERDSLRKRAELRERELVRLRATDVDFRRRISLIRDHYIQFATEFLKQLKHIDLMIHEAGQKADGPADNVDDATLISLAHRFSPDIGTAKRPSGEES